MTDDAEGEFTQWADPDRLAAVTEDEIVAAVGRLTGDIQQVPSSVSAIKVDGKRSYARVRGGEDVELPARPVTVSEFTVHGIRRGDGRVPGADPAGPGEERTAGGAIDVSATVTCSSGTYIRALARDLGRALGVGGHLTGLRRTRVGGFSLQEAHTLDELTEQVRSGGTVSTVGIADAARRLFPARELSAVEATDLSHGRRISAQESAGESAGPPSGPGSDRVVACFAPDGTLVALAQNRGGADHRYATSVLGITAGTTFHDAAPEAGAHAPAGAGETRSTTTGTTSGRERAHE